ncbi:MAG: Rne/Rng family ribonuclease [Acidobacteriota bacterium]|nr:Rne/Rng family ribonuclease [Acidobacteriota bacterium]
MRKELLVNATPPETRVALMEDQRVVEVFHERRGHRGLVGNVYLGRVHRVLPGMQAAFVSIGLDRDAFLYVEDALPGTVEEEGDDTAVAAVIAGRGAPSEERPRIDDLVKEGQEIVVQVTKDPLSGKGPRVTAALSLPGRTLVYLPSAREIGISRRISDETERDRLRQLLGELPGSGGLIARTAAAGAGAAELAADQRYLMELAGRIARQSERSAAPALLHRELDLSLRVVRDLVSTDFAAIRVDDEATHARLIEFLSAVAPSLVRAVELCPSEPPLFETAGVQQEISRGLRRHVELPSGGSIVIQQTEALVAIDVNTGKFVGKDGLEETVFAANLEAVPEIARQIRLRDLGGLLVIDFIDMADPAHRREVFEKFELELARDRARTRLLQLSEFGLVEVTRQRSRGNLEKTLTTACPCCSGRGRVRTDLTLALELRRDLLRPPLLYSRGETIRVRVPPSLGRLLAEEERTILEDVQERLGVDLEIQADATLSPEEYEIGEK